MAENCSLYYVTTERPEVEEDLVFVGFFGSLICLGVAANLYIIVCILARRRLRTSHNAYIVNISAADLLLSVNGIFSFLEMIGRFGSLTQEACRLLGVMSLVPAFVVVLSMVVIARSRYKAVTELGGGGSTTLRPARLILATLACIWSFSVLVAMPIVFGWVSMGSGLFCACCFYFSENIEYGVAISISMYLVPNLLIAWYYVRILRYVRRSRRRVQQHRCTAPSQTPAQLRGRNEIRLAIQFIVIFLVFNLCYAPSMVVFWLQDEDRQVPEAVDSFAMVLFSTNVLALPVIFIVFNRAAREEMRNALRICRTKGKARTPSAPKVVTRSDGGDTSGTSERSVTNHSGDEAATPEVPSLSKVVVGTAFNTIYKTSVQSVSLSDNCQNIPDNPLPIAM